MERVVIIGNGVAGVTAARYIRKMSDNPITIISAESKHFFSRTALMYVYMGHMRFKEIKPYEDFFWDKNRLNLIQAYVETVDTANKKLTLSNGKTVEYDVLILATGSQYNKFNWPGQDLDGVNGLYSLQDLEYMEYYSKDTNKAVIVGGGLIGIEMAEMFMSRGIEVTFLVRETSYWRNVLPPQESEMVNRHIGEHHVDLRLGTELKEIISDENGRVRAVVTSAGDTVECQFVGLTAGVHPNVAFLKDSGIETDRGILVDEYLQTNVKDVYALGDCAQLRTPPAGRKPIEAVWYVGKMMGETVAFTITGQPRKYDPGLWFNSAKFFDIEYQVYGDVPAKIPEEIESLYWEGPEGKRSVRINWNRATGAVTGFNLMGVRYRHRVCEKWIADQTPIEEVIANLKAANFDPEFYAKTEGQIARAYAKLTGKPAPSQKSKSGLWSFILNAGKQPNKPAAQSSGVNLNK